ncbi:MAG TPA: hypothetical protein VLT90_07915 [Terriglobales bacterium]|nr:hypothetical protein [Terriglobales bacterium]
MTCPFLKETQVKFCQMAGVRKLIPSAGPSASDAQPPGEKCTSRSFTECPVFQRQARDTAAAARCPWLQESLMQYCSAASVPRLVPYSESVLSRCGNGAFRYCEVYLSLAHPLRDDEEVDGVRMPSWLLYSANHMWLDMTAEGRCHAGIDGFLARTLGQVERISYVWQHGQRRPTAVITAGGVDLHIMFPNPLLLTSCNLYLRADPARLTAEPYTAGWLFEGEVLPETTTGLMTGADARGWMRAEHGRMNEFIHQHFAPAGLAGDGGVLSPGLVSMLGRDQAVALFHEFFSPFARDPRKP